MPRLAEGEFALVQDHLGQAILAPTDPVRWGAGGTELDFHVLCAEAAAQSRDSAGLAEHAPRAAEMAERMRHGLYTGIARRAQGVALRLAGQSQAAVERQTDAADLFLALGTRWQLGRTLVERAEVHASAGNLSEARADYVRALEAFEAVGAKPAAAEVRRAMQTLT